MMNKISKYIVILSIMVLSSVLIYYCLKNNSFLFLFEERFIRRYVIFNLIFFFNLIIIMNPKYSQYWYLIYLLQLSIAGYLNRKILIVTSIDDIVFWIAISYSLAVIGYSFYNYVKNFYKFKYQRGIEFQNEFYGTILKKYPWLNTPVFIRNVITINLGAMELPEKISFRGYILHSILLIMVSYFSWTFNYKILLSMAIFCIVINYGYETLYDNYRSSKEFKRNFDVNVRYWMIKLSKNNDFGKNGIVIKRYMSGPARENIKVAAGNMFSFSMTNPRVRTMYVIGGSLILTSVIVVGGTWGNKYLEGKTIVEKEKVIQHGKVSVEEVTQNGKTDRLKMKIAEERRREEVAEERRKAEIARKKRSLW